MNRTDTKEPLLLLAIAVGGLFVSGLGPVDRMTWFLEVAPVLLGIPLAIATFRRFPLSLLLYRLILLHSLVLMLGGHYTYANVPLGFWLQDLFHFGRNHYDRIGHFMQGFVPAILAREILIRRSPLGAGRWMFFLVVCICLAFSALYELIEWWSAVILGQGAEAFLGTQGDAWDTQWDMFLALVGAITAQIALGRYHERELSRTGLLAGNAGSDRHNM